MKYFLTIDNGGTNTKVVLFTQCGHQVAVSSFPTPGLEPKPGFHEINLNQLKQTLLKAIKQTILDAQIDSKEIVALTTVGHGKGLYVLDEQRQIFTSGILSADSRGKNLAQKFEKEITQIFSISNQHVMPSQAPILLRWLKENQPEIYTKIGIVFSNKDFIGYLLTGECKQELGDASGNNLVNLQTKQYDARLFDFFEIPEMLSKMPPLITATQKRGSLLPEIAQEVGLPENLPVIAGMFDIDACCLATGVLDEQYFNLIAGTWNINTFPSDTLAKQDSGLMNSCFVGEKYLIEASSPTSAGNLEIIIKMLMTAELRDVKDAGASIYDNLEHFLNTTDATFSQVLYLPFLYGSQVNQDATGSFLGLQSTTTKSELIRAVYEGITFAHRYHVEQLLQVVAKPPKALRLAGGATNSQSWMQMFADVLNLPVETVEANELGGLGGAIIAAVSLEIYPDLTTAVANMVKGKQCFLPDVKQVEIYAKKYQAYRQILIALEQSWTVLKTMTKEEKNDD